MKRLRRTPRRPADPTRALVLLGQKRLSASGLAKELGVSEVTAKRVVAALRRGGHEIASVRSNGEVYYEARDNLTWEEIERDPFFTTLVTASRTHPPRGKPEDADYDRD